MMNWVAERQTKDELAPVIQGVQPASSISGSESLAWNAQQALNLNWGYLSEICVRCATMTYSNYPSIVTEFIAAQGRGDYYTMGFDLGLSFKLCVDVNQDG